MESGRDVHATLAEMERTLRELSSELARATGEAAQPPAPHPPPPAPPSPASPPPSPPTPPPSAASPPPPPASFGALADARRALDSLEAALSAGAPAPGEALLTAGPFVDVAGLARFEAALRGLDGVEEVSLRGFEGDRALLEVRLGTDRR
jgi:hypothetical protein